jgi:hypothetical protein
MLVLIAMLASATALAQQHGKHSKATKPKAAAPLATKPAISGAVAPDDRPVPVSTDPGSPAPKGPTRIDFDDRLIEGQSNKSGAVYLYDRKDLAVDSMVKQPSTFRSEIARGLFE